MKVFDFLSYKMFLSKYIESSGRRGLISELAKAAGCSHSYLSQVLNGKPDLTLDQAWALTEHLSFKKDEAEYFFLLVLNERAASPTLKKNLETKLKSIKKEQFHTDRAVSAPTDEHLQASQRDRYYSNWNVGAVHILTACPSFQKIEDLSKRLNLPALEIEHILNWLIENDLVKKRGSNFIHAGKSIHLPSEAIHNQINHLNWRLRGVQASLKEENIHYTSTFSISKKEWDVLQANLLDFIEMQRKTILSSGSEDGFVFCCDLFKI